MSVGEGKPSETASADQAAPGKQAAPPSGGPSTNACLAGAALVASVVGEIYLTRIPGMLSAAFVCFGVSIVLFLALALSVERTQAHRPVVLTRLDRLLTALTGRMTPALMLAFLSLALALIVLGLLRNKADKNYWGIFALWIASGLAYAAAFIRIGKPKLGSWIRDNRPDLILVAALSLAAGILRFVWLGKVPNIISGDEGVIGLLMKAALRGDLSNMLATAYGHGTLYLNVMAAFAAILGRTDPFALRITSAIAGTLTAPVLYVLARRLFNRRVAVLAAALLAVSHIHVHFSRVIVAGSIQDALFTTLVWYLFLTGLEARSRNRLVAAGIMLGLFLYLYMGARLTMALVPVYLGALFLTDRKALKGNGVNLLLFAGALAVLAAPMAHWALNHPDEFNARLNQTGIIQNGWLANEARITGKSQAVLLVQQFRDSFLSVIYYPASAFYGSRRPMLDAISGAAFILGLAYALLHFRDKRHLLLLGWFWSAVAGGALVVSPALAAYRILVVLPAVCIFVAIGWDRLIAFAGGVFARRAVQLGAVAAIVAFTAGLNLKYYFFDCAFTCVYEDPMTRLASYMGEYYGRIGPQRYQAYLLGAPRITYGIHRSVDFFTNNRPIKDIREPLKAPPADLGIGRPAVFFFTPERHEEIRHIRQLLPDGQEDVIRDCGAALLYVYLAP